MDEFQEKAIRHRSGPALCVAGPGSGKTTVLTHHIRFLIESGLFKPEEIMVLTFTRKASESMRERFTEIAKDLNESHNITFGTFHSVFYKILRTRFGSLNIIPDIERSKLIESITPKDHSADDLINFISRIKTDREREIKNYERELFSAYKFYDLYLKERSMIDLDDIMLYFYEKLKTDINFSDTVKSRYKAILIDEFQDINKIQYEIVRSLTGRDTHIFAVGDEDQSIYGFRGSDPTIMKRFSEEFDAEIYLLKNNYRSTEGIKNASKILISHNKSRLKDNEDKPSRFKNTSDDLLIKIFKDRASEVKFIRSEVAGHEDTGILLRTNKDVKYYLDILLNDDLKTETLIAETVRDYTAFSLFNEREDLFKILDIPERFLLRNIFTDEKVDLKRIANVSRGKRYASDLDRLCKDIDMIKRSHPLTSVIYLKKVVGLERFFVDRYVDIGFDKINDAFKKLEDTARGCGSLNEFYLKIKDGPDHEAGTGHENIKIMTYHAAKGLEFDKVILPDCIEGKIPGKSPDGSIDIEEERRLFYVAMTRARKELLICTLKNPDGISNMPSGFIKDFL